MTQRDFNKLGNVQAAMDTLRMYNSFVLFPATEEILQSSALEAYFNSPLDAPIERKVEKMVCVAAIRAVYENPDIPQMNKDRAARVTARGLRAALQVAKLEHKASSNELTVQEYNRRKRSNIIVKKAVKVRMAKTLAKNVTITTLAGAVAGSIGASIAVGTRILWRFMPDKIRKPVEKRLSQVKEAAYNTLTNTVRVIRNQYETFKSTKVGQKVERAIKAIEPYATKVKDVVVKTATKVKTFLKSILPF